jgi:hypothetical protein
MHSYEVAGEVRVGQDRLGEGNVGQDVVLLVTGESSQASDLDIHQPRGPRLTVDSRAGVSTGWIPGHELAGLDEASFGPAA